MSGMGRVFLILFLICMMAQYARADKVVLKDGSTLKGVVVEDYSDRVTLSTHEGEKSILRAEIAGIEYDSMEDNLLNLGARYKDEGDLAAAYFYYKQALKLNPASRVARDGVFISSQSLFRKEQKRHEDAVKKQEIIEEFGRFGELREKQPRANILSLAEDIGLSLRVSGVNPEVVTVRRGSAAEEGRVAVGDKVIAIWSRLTGYLSMEDIVARLTDTAQREVKLTIERGLRVRLRRPRLIRTIKNIIGARFVAEWDGLTVKEVFLDGPAEAAGLMVNDIVAEIAGKATRYMSADEAHRLIKSSGPKLDLVIRREMTVWKR